MRESAYNPNDGASVITRHPKKKKEVSAGGVIAGGASGALAGAQMGSALGPWGTAGGAVLGGILGAYTGSQSKGDVSQVANAKQSFDKNSLRMAAAAKKAKKLKDAKGSADGFLKAGEYIMKAT